MNVELASIYEETTSDIDRANIANYTLKSRKLVKRECVGKFSSNDFANPFCSEILLSDEMEECDRCFISIYELGPL